MSKIIFITNKEYTIYELPGRSPAMLDRDLANILQVGIDRVGALKRNIPERFPEGFFYTVTPEESTKIGNLEESFSFPTMYTLEGCVMIFTFCRSDDAAKYLVQILKGFKSLQEDNKIEVQDALLNLEQVLNIKQLPSIPQEDLTSEFLSTTGLAKLLGLPEKFMNEFLEEVGLQIKNTNGEYHPTYIGETYSKCNNNSLLWNKSKVKELYKSRFIQK
jgi:hypothetical protein